MFLSGLIDASSVGECASLMIESGCWCTDGGLVGSIDGSKGAMLVS